MSIFARQNSIKYCLPLFNLALMSLTGLGLLMSPSQAKDIDLKVGIIQRFGDENKDQLSLKGPKGEILTIRFLDKQGQRQTVESKQAQLAIAETSLSTPFLEERLVLSDHATFETAEDSANQWRALGIPVEITQPDRWQVWAKRDVYSSPLVRRWLLQSLREKGYQVPYLSSEVLRVKPQAVLNVNGKSYVTNDLEVTTPTNLIQVTEGKQRAQLYGGSLKLQTNAYGNYTLVNNVPLETYLRGVVPHEIGHNAPENAAKAQTIIARTYALRNLRRFEADNYELCATTHCQVYFGLKETNLQADRAISDTKGLVLTYNGELVDAPLFFHDRGGDG